MLVSDLAERCRRLKPIQPSTYTSWQKAIKPIEQLAVSDVTHTTTLDYRMQQLKPWGPLAEGTLKARHVVHSYSQSGTWHLRWSSTVCVRQSVGMDTSGKQYTKSDVNMGRKILMIIQPLKHSDPLFLGYWYHGVAV